VDAQIDALVVELDGMKGSSLFGEGFLEHLLEQIGQYNQMFFPFSLILPSALALMAILLVLFRFTRPNARSGCLMNLFLALLYAIAGFETFYPTFLGEVTVEYIIGAVIMWVFSLLFVWDAFQRKTAYRLSPRTDLKVLSLLLMSYGIFVYPLVEWMLGFTWPKMVFFGAECPSTIFTIGLLIGSIPRVNKIIYVALSIGAVISGGTFSMLGATFDIAYFASGVCGLLMLIKYRKEVFGRTEDTTQSRV